jgi:hypothetical protein
MITPPSNSRHADPKWRLLIEFPLAVFLSERSRNHDPAAGLLFQALCKLDISSECVADIERSLVDFAAHIWRHFQGGEHDVPGQVRIFYQRKRIGGHAALQPYPLDHRIQNALVVPGLNRKTNGGWGFFLIARGGDVASHGPQNPANLVDVYLYREGE